MQVTHGSEDAAVPRTSLEAALPLVYDDLLRLAQRQLGREFAPRSLDAASLVHEAYLKLAANTPTIDTPPRLLALAAHAMRQVLVDHARHRNADKRGGQWARVTLTDGSATTDIDPEQLLALDDALERLEARQRAVVECRFFGGLSDAEIAQALGVTTRTVQRDWLKARAWLGRWLSEGTPSG